MLLPSARQHFAQFSLLFQGVSIIERLPSRSSLHRFAGGRSKSDPQRSLFVGGCQGLLTHSCCQPSIVLIQQRNPPGRLSPVCRGKSGGVGPLHSPNLLFSPLSHCLTTGFPCSLRAKVLCSPLSRDSCPSCQTESPRRNHLIVCVFG